MRQREVNQRSLSRPATNSYTPTTSTSWWWWSIIRSDGTAALSPSCWTAPQRNISLPGYRALLSTSGPYISVTFCGSWPNRRQGSKQRLWQSRSPRRRKRKWCPIHPQLLQQHKEDFMCAATATLDNFHCWLLAASFIVGCCSNTRKVSPLSASTGCSDNVKTNTYTCCLSRLAECQLLQQHREKQGFLNWLILMIKKITGWKKACEISNGKRNTIIFYKVAIRLYLCTKENEIALLTLDFSSKNE